MTGWGFDILIWLFIMFRHELYIVLKESKFELQPLKAHNSAQIAATKLRIELPESSLRARGHEIGFRPYFLILFNILLLCLTF